MVSGQVNLDAFENRSKDWGKDMCYRLKTEDYPYLEKELIDEIKEFEKDISELFNELSYKGIPLSYILIGQKV